MNGRRDLDAGADPRAILIAGPTASGKSAAALELAVRFRGTVINADSMQVYDELRVLTARPNLDEERLVPHRLYGIASVNNAYSVGRWLSAAEAAIKAVQDEGRLPILTGGTGLYFKALTEGLAPVPEIPADIPALWRQRADRLSTEDLHAELAARDPAMAARLLPTDPQRILRAIEVMEATGVSLADWQEGRAEPVLDPQAALKVVIAPDRALLYAKIDRRLDDMLENGAVEEVRALIDRNVDLRLPAMQAHGVPEIAAWLKGEAGREEAVSRAKMMSRRYAKRQFTWLRRFMADWAWFSESAAAVEWAKAQLQQRAPV